ncbi:MAG: SPFH domain-containing protein [Bdellovibrionota bacterium]
MNVEVSACRGQSVRGEAGAVSPILSAVIGIALLASVVLTLLYTVFGTVVPPDKIGVRINYFSFGFLTQGYSKSGMKPGLHLKFPGVSDIALLPRGFQFINLHKELLDGDLNLGELQVQSSNGPRVNTDVTWIIRLNEDTVNDGPTEPPPLDLGPEEGPVPIQKTVGHAHGGPDDLITFFGFDGIGQLRKFAQIAQNELGKALNRLTSSDFYNPVARERAAVIANRNVNIEVNPYGVELWATLIRRYRYEKEEIDNQIFAKNLQTQTAKLRVAQTALAEVTAQIEKTKELWNQKIQEKYVESQSYLLQKEADARFAEEIKVSEGEKELKTKTAVVTAEKNKLLTELSGADVYVARELVPLVKTLNGGVVSNLDPYDIDTWVTKLVGAAHGSGAKEQR